MADDVVVVGSGGAGLAAAVSAAARGAKVTVLETAPVFGGTTAISGGAMWLPRIEDPAESPDVSLTHLRHLTLGRVADAVLRRYVDEAPNVATFLTRETALEMLPEPGRPDYHADFPGGALSGRTVYPALFDTTSLGEWRVKLRRPAPGGFAFAPATTAEARAHRDDPEGLARLVLERTDKGIVRGGPALIGGLMHACIRRGVRLISGARAMELAMNDGRVTGVVAQVEGHSERFDARSGVVLAAGGFEWDRRLWDELIGVPYDGAASPPHNVGDGLRLAMGAGARLGNLTQVWWTPSRYLGTTQEGRPTIRIGTLGAQAGEVMVNRRGRRFANESLNYNDIGKVMVHFDPHTYEFPNYPAFVICDQKRRPAVESPVPGSDGDPLMEAPTLRALADKAGIDPLGLEDQVREFNRYAENGVDLAFHRGETPWETYQQRGGARNGSKNPTLLPIDEPPFYGFRARAGVFGTKGGPVIDANAQVLGLDEKPIRGLYAAGNVTAGVFGPAYPGGGGTIGPGVTFGYVAGISATSG